MSRIPNNVLRSLPSVNELLESPPLKKLVERVNRNVVVTEARSFLDKLRSDLKSAAEEIHIPNPTELADRIAQWITNDQTPHLRPVINATGILLHTGLGRAALAREALDELAAICGGYCSLEVDLEQGQRGQRIAAVEKLLTDLTGAEAAAVANNNAAATMLTLSALAQGKEVIVSRGQLVEIGGSYRLPDVMEVSGANLREVGTTNKARLSDYEQACGEHTGAILRVHTSNFKVVGFTESVPIADLVKLGRQKNIPVIDDIGSGAVIDLSPFGLHDEPLAQDSIKAGVDITLFSGDKLLGGPQCGIIVGRRELVRKIVQHPLMRAMRVGKLTLSVLAATLRLYGNNTVATNSIPLLSLLATSEENLKNRAERLAPQIAAAAAVESAEPVADENFLGGGSVPGQKLKTWCVSIEPNSISVDDLATHLRTGNPSVLGRIKENRLLLDLRAVFPSQDIQMVEAVQACGGDVDGADGEGQEKAE